MENYRGLSGRRSLEFIFDPMPHHRRTRLVTRRYIVEFEINFETIARSQSMAKRGSRLIIKKYKSHPIVSKFFLQIFQESFP
jgi:hypothetical protein